MSIPTIPPIPSIPTDGKGHKKEDAPCGTSPYLILNNFLELVVNTELQATAGEQIFGQTSI